MRILLIKSSSMGDVTHTFPALNDAIQCHENLTVDWLVEEDFKVIPLLHPGVHTIIPVAIRRWRKSWLNSLPEIQSFIRKLRQTRYDLIIDAQGLIKSGMIGFLARGQVCGFDRKSAKEPWVNCFYSQGVNVPKDQHAVERTRQLFAKILGYSIEGKKCEYGLKFPVSDLKIRPFIVFLHGTTWETKHWPESYWIELAKSVLHSGLDVKLPFGNEAEKARANRIAEASNASGNGRVEVLNQMSLLEVLAYIKSARAIVALDSGLAHLAASLGKPTISLFGPTDPSLTSPYGENQIVLQADFNCAPCMKKFCFHPDRIRLNPPCLGGISPQKVFVTLQALLTLPEL